MLSAVTMAPLLCQGREVMRQEIEVSCNVPSWMRGSMVTLSKFTVSDKYSFLYNGDIDSNYFFSCVD